jgi:hypothetical protein
MLPEIIIFKYLLIYNNYIKYYKYININKDIYKELYYIYHTLPSFFEQYPRDASVDEFSVYFFTFYPRLRAEELDAYARIFEQAKSSEVNDEALIRGYLDDAQRRSTAFEIATTALAFAEGREVREKLFDSINEFQSPTEIDAPKTQFVSDDLDALIETAVKTPGLRWRLASLNRSLGSLRIGDFGFVFARPESGKTTFLSSEVTYFATQTEKPILWLNNEEQGDKVKLRCFQAALGAPLEVLISDREKSKEYYKNLVGGRIKIYDSGEIYRPDVETMIPELSPALIIFDQIDKIRGFEADRRDLMMGDIYQWAREIAKKQCPVIGVCQADGTGEGVKWLNMNHVADAKTAKQAEADWILGIGKTHEPELEFVRHFNISKNKLFGDQDSDPKMKHGSWDVIIQPEIARYRDLGG